MGVNLLGHSHPLYIKAHLEAATSDTFTCGNLLSYPDALEFSRNIIRAVSGSRLKHFWYSCSGSMANDTALKMIWQKMSPKRKIIADGVVYNLFGLLHTGGHEHLAVGVRLYLLPSELPDVALS
jgi:4-aminobutyrate aminotransferase-like enzyme